MFDMITIGDIKLDTFVILDEASVQCQLKMPDCLLCIDYGAKIPVKVVDSQIAGTAPNVATGLARMGMKTAVMSIMGEDGTRHLALTRFKEEGISPAYIRVSKKEPSAYSVVLNFKGEKTILTSHIQRAYRLPRKLGRTKWMYVGEMGPGYELLYRSIMALRKKQPIFLGINPGTIQIEERKQIFLDFLSTADVLFVNREEAQKITQVTTTEIHHLATSLWQLGAKKVVITDGGNGSYSFDGKELHSCPIFPGKLVEATGAGDAFSTGYISALMHNQFHDEALRWGAVNSTSVVGKVGPQAGLLTLSQIRRRLRKVQNFHVVKM
ncbi:MAG: hypothetical protein UU31_C0005G0017 [Candidatus Uhrbacteria bacterium GW2011_GWA2_41_10]|nr:MAG: hypothetical protein UU31_C0005G0017 [Candidatus Uhrbacteria bacterium GW2011_GWA2_41_10]